MSDWQLQFLLAGFPHNILSEKIRLCLWVAILYVHVQNRAGDSGDYSGSVPLEKVHWHIKDAVYQPRFCCYRNSPSEEIKGHLEFLSLKKNDIQIKHHAHHLPLVSTQLFANESVPDHVGFARVKINLINENDNRPIFSQVLYNISLFENVTVGTSVLKVLVSWNHLSLNLVGKSLFLLFLSLWISSVLMNTTDGFSWIRFILPVSGIIHW